MHRLQQDIENPEEILDQEGSLAVGARTHSPLPSALPSFEFLSTPQATQQAKKDVPDIDVNSSESSKKILSHLLIDNPTETFVNLPSGKINKRENRTALKGQTGVSCILYAMRRLAFFNDLDVNGTRLYKAYRTMKKAIVDFDNDFNALFDIFKTLCTELNMDIEQVISRATSYSEAEKSIKRIQCSLLYEALIKQRFFSLFNFQESGWHPKNGFAGLQESLRNNGAHVFIGKFGAWCHGGKSSLVRLENENSHNRETFGFAKGSYAGDQSPWTHAVVIDKVKIVNGIEMIYFRDPYDKTGEQGSERVYRLSYENFVSRLTNQQSHRYGSMQCQDKAFGIVSKYPAKLI